jgi:uncharacterized membrane protein
VSKSAKVVLGTIVFGSKKVKVIAEVGPHIVKVESYLTILSALTQIITGLWMASIVGFSVLTGWLGWALILFCFGPPFNDGYDWDLLFDGI